MAIKVNVNKDWIKFIPEYENNKECPKDQMVSCMIKYISVADQDKASDLMIESMRKGKKSNIRPSRTTLELINDHVKDIKNVFVIESGIEKELKTMKELYVIPHLKGLYEEIANALEASSSINEEEAKN